MTGQERREAILHALQAATAPLSGAALGKEFGVSRQVVVQDIALLRTQGFPIVSTNRGYLISSDVPRAMRLLKLHHTLEQTEEEQTCIVDLGGTIVDVMVNHRVYGKMSANMDIKNRRDVRTFINDIETGVSTPLMLLTNGYHFHHISADSEEALDDIQSALAQKGFLAPWTEYEQENFESLAAIDNPSAGMMKKAAAYTASYPDITVGSGKSQGDSYSVSREPYTEAISGSTGASAPITPKHSER